MHAFIHAYNNTKFLIHATCACTHADVCMWARALPCLFVCVLGGICAGTLVYMCVWFMSIAAALCSLSFVFSFILQPNLTSTV